MKTLKLTLPLIAAASMVMAGCPGDDSPGGETEDTGSTGTDTSATMTTPMTMTAADTSSSTGPDTDTETATETATDTNETDTETDTESGDDPFVFEETDPADYTQVDRQGFPAVNTGLNLLGDKDMYNAASPVEDAGLDFLDNILESLETLHLGVPGMQVMDNTGLDDDLGGLGLTPCVAAGMTTCDNQGFDFVIPDTIKIDLEDENVFPNGRTPAFPVMDVIFAVLLLDLTTHEITTFLDLDGDGTPGPSLNPLANDVMLPEAWPYLAPAQ